LVKCPDLIPYCYEKSQNSGEVNLITTSLAEQLLNLFCQKISKVYIVIDGLDECDTGQQRLVLSFFTKMVAQCDEYDPGKLRFLVVSQDSKDIAKALHPAPIVKLSAKDNKDDITKFVSKWCKKIQEKFELDRNKIEEIQDITCIRAQGMVTRFYHLHRLTVAGMFLYAKLVMENLFAQNTQLDVLEETKEYQFPEDLGAA
jgi:hypothetical protein